MTNVAVSSLGSRVLLPAYAALAVTVPAFVFAVYDTLRLCENPPDPVTVAVQGVCAVPS